MAKETEMDSDKASGDRNSSQDKGESQVYQPQFRLSASSKYQSSRELKTEPSLLKGLSYKCVEMADTLLEEGIIEEKFPLVDGLS